MTEKDQTPDLGVEQELIDIFLEEAEEILVQLEEDLLKLEKEPDNKEIIDSVFRSAHTIKGSAGLTGLTSISNFAHVLEDMLDRVRKESGQLPESHMMVLLDSVDLLKKMVEALTEGGLDDLLERAEEIKELLNFIMDLDPSETSAETAEEVKFEKYRVSLELDKDLFTRGTDPLMLIRELKEKGRIIRINVRLADLPPLEELKPDKLFLSWTVFFESDVPQSEIENIFIFVDDQVEIKPLDYEEDVETLAERELHEILVEEGIVDSREIENAKDKEKKVDDILVEEGKVASKQIASLSKKKAKAKESQEITTIRVDTGKLEQILNYVAELAISQARAKEIVMGGRDMISQEDEISFVFEEIEKTTRQLQEEVMRASMVPIGGTFVRFQRMVRDLAKEKGKEIELIIKGKETELDRKVIEQINDPLKHMLRNAIDHGIESPEEREKKGKPRQGKIILNAFHKEGGIIIEVSDDGRGLDPDKLLLKAQEKGLVDPQENLSKDEILQLPFRAGFSTAREVSDISGRGVGLDVVSNNIQALRGSVELESEVDIGTKISVRLPLTLAIIDAMLITAGEQTFLVPVTSVIEFVKISSEKIKHVTGRAPLVMIRGDYIPLVTLGDLFNISGSARKVEDGMVIVLQDQRRRLALLVDEIWGQEQVVIKSIKENFQQVEGLAGATILGDGQVAMILDVGALIRLAGRRRG